MNSRDEEHQATIETTAEEPAPDETSNEDARAVSRRHILRGAAIGAPVLLTLANRPALATGGGGYKCSVSGMGSVSTRASSRYHGCYGCGPSIWKHHKAEWIVHHGNTFKNTFGSYIYFKIWPHGGHDDDTIGLCCDAGDDVLHAECVGALLNSLHFPAIYGLHTDAKSYIGYLFQSGYSKWWIKQHLMYLRGSPNW